MMQLFSIAKLVCLSLLLPTMAYAGSGNNPVVELQRDWAIANYNLSGVAQEQAFESLIERADLAVSQHPKSADVLIWNGIIKSSYAGSKGGLGALSFAKQAKKSLESAIKLDDRALNGSAYTSLGTLYYKVPGWPLGFGNDKKAVQLLQKALEINPDGIDSNYFYADYLLEKKDFAQAEQYLLKAQSATPRPDRPVADAGRHEEIRAALLTAQDKLGHSATVAEGH